jgi:hypothetical protein
MKFEDIHTLMQKPDVKPDTYEAGMALNQLLKIGTHAIKIHNMIDDDQEMEAWVAKKIDLASNYVKSVHGYTAGEKAGTYDDDGMSEMKRMPKGTGTMQGVKEAESDYLYHNGKEIDQGSIVYDMQDYSDGIFELQSAKYADGTELDEKELEELESTQELIDWVMIDFVSESAVQEDAGEGHMSKSQLYQTAKMAIELLDMINKGDDLEGWVQTKLNLAADYLQAVYHYEDYQKLNPYREEIDSNILHRHAGIIQKHLDEILERKCRAEDVDTKPGMMRILKKRVNEVEKELAKENRKNTDEVAPPGREKQVKKLKGKFKDKGAPYAIAWAQHNKHGKPKKEAELEEGLKDWARNLAMAGVVVAGLAGVGSINDAINNSVPAVKAMNTAYEMAVDQGQTELANQIKKDLSAVKVRLDSGKDLNFVKDMQDKYSKFMKTEGLAYESKLAIMLDQRIK